MDIFLRRPDWMLIPAISVFISDGSNICSPLNSYPGPAASALHPVILYKALPVYLQHFPHRGHMGQCHVGKIRQTAPLRKFWIIDNQTLEKRPPPHTHTRTPASYIWSFLIDKWGMGPDDDWHLKKAWTLCKRVVGKQTYSWSHSKARWLRIWVHSRIGWYKWGSHDRGFHSTYLSAPGYSLPETDYAGPLCPLSVQPIFLKEQQALHFRSLYLWIIFFGFPFH